MHTSGVGKLASLVLIASAVTLMGATAALAQDAPPSINFSFGDSSTPPPSLGSAQTNSSSSKPPSLGTPSSNTQDSKPPSLEYIPATNTQSTSTNSTTSSNATPTTSPQTSTTQNTPSALEPTSVPNSRPAAPSYTSKRTNLPKTGPELAFLIIPTLATSAAYKFYRKKK